MTAPAGNHRLTTDLQIPMMDSAGNPDFDINHPMESTFGNAVQRGSSPSDLDLQNLENDEQHPPTPTPHSIADYRGPATYNPPQGLDGQANLYAPSGKAHGCVYVTLPDVFDRK
jgi:hypothetical protein